MQIDIRGVSDEKVDSIKFGNGCDECYAYFITLNGIYTKIESQDSEVYLCCEEDARNLIKALEKAIELGTWN